MAKASSGCCCKIDLLMYKFVVYNFVKMDKASSDCPYPGCFFSVMKEVLPIRGLWNTAMAHPNDPEFIKLGIFECMAALRWKGLKNRRLLSHDQNIYIPYYAAHIIGSYMMNMEKFAETAWHAGYADRRLSYHCDLITCGMGGVEMESRTAEEWASQLQCRSLQLINCFAFNSEFHSTICKPEFLIKLPGMWGGLVNENSPAGIGLLRTICHHKFGWGAIASFPGIVEALCNIAQSSDDWQYMAIDCLLWLLQDPSTCHKVIDKAVPAMLDLAEITTLGDRKKLGDSIVNVLLEYLHIKQAAALVVKLEGNSLFSSGNISGAALKYSEAMALCPMRSKRERVVLYSNRAQCHLLLQQPLAAVSDATHALCLHNPVNRHAKSLWRRAQAYDMLGLAKESLLDAILFINECSQSNDPDHSLRQNKVPDYAEQLVKKQMRAAWLFRDAAIKHGSVDFQGDAVDIYGQELHDSEWETASESDL
ncbi:Tetratricopeptide repeat protein like [Quillaja saponaria]|uniref:Tetratricopeptide repeat protein like n=1 Tax=Quillaja saponaria TaxID=32244 RepID=A0AAD7LVJ2_QUISA|nr:Tetratricopeptide repeat protein like [Quillaja saponaria]